MTHEHNGHADPPDVGLDELALRYVMDELNTDEVEAFEARLADDQLARESVSRMVLLGTAVVREGEVLVPHTETAGSGATSGWSGGWRLAVAAVLVVAVGLAVYLTRPGATPDATGDTANTERPLEEEAQDLIASWVDFGDLRVAHADTALETSFDPYDDVDALGNGGEVTLDIGAEAPSWMLQALDK